jgi:phospholipid/cholesterol/gamma-HCH transport system substrate-binding protein
MNRDRRLSLTVGAFALAALGAFAVTILSLSAEQGLFRPRYTLIGWFENVQGLVPGAAVRLAGTRVGEVRDVDLGLRPEGTPGVRVVLAIDEAVRERITRDSRARITTVGLLGDQIVEISIGSSGSEPLGEGDTLATLEPFDLGDMVAKGQEVLDAIASIETQGGQALEAIESLARNLDGAVGDFQKGMGSQRLAETLGGFGEIVQEVQKGDGVLHALVYEPAEESALADLERALASFANVMEQVERGDGFLHSLVYKSPTDQALLFEFLEAGARLNSILGKMDRGEGTLGLLLNDPTLYEELKRLVGGAGRSTVVRTLIDLVTSEGAE